MLILSGKPGQEKRRNNNNKMFQAEEKAGRRIWRKSQHILGEPFQHGTKTLPEC